MRLDLLAYLFGAVALLGLVGTGVYKVKTWGADEVRAEWKEAETNQREEEIQRSLNAAAALWADRGKRRVKIQERTVYVDRNIEKLVDSGSCFADPGVRCANAVIGGTGAAGQCADGAVPAAPPAR